MRFVVLCCCRDPGDCLPPVVVPKPLPSSLNGPLARINVCEKNCFGMIVWKAVLEAVSRFLPWHTAVVGWKHRNQEGVLPVPKDRGAEQGDVDGPLECSLALGSVAAETRGRVSAQQASGSLPWIGVDDPSEMQRLQADQFSAGWT